MSSGTFEVKIGKEVYEVDAKDENEAWQLANKFHASTPPEPAPAAQTQAPHWTAPNVRDSYS
jgi:hypothetical protein